MSNVIGLFLIFMYRRDLFEEESDRLRILRRAQEIPVDRIENPFTIRIDENRSNLNGIRNKNDQVNRTFFFLMFQMAFSFI